MNNTKEAVKIDIVKINQILKQEGLTKIWVSEKMGNSATYLNNAMSRGKMPQSELEKLAKYLYTTPEALIAKDPEPEVEPDKETNADIERLSKQVADLYSYIKSFHEEQLQVIIENAIITGFGVAMQDTLNEVVKQVGINVYSEVLGAIKKGGVQ